MSLSFEKFWFTRGFGVHHCLIFDDLLTIWLVCASLWQVHIILLPFIKLQFTTLAQIPWHVHKTYVTEFLEILVHPQLWSTPLPYFRWPFKYLSCVRVIVTKFTLFYYHSLIFRGTPMGMVSITHHVPSGRVRHPKHPHNCPLVQRRYD